MNIVSKYFCIMIEVDKSLNLFPYHCDVDLDNALCRPLQRLSSMINHIMIINR